MDAKFEVHGGQMRLTIWNGDDSAYLWLPIGDRLPTGFAAEIARNVEFAAKRLESASREVHLFDSTGNDLGVWILTGENPYEEHLVPVDRQVEFDHTTSPARSKLGLPSHAKIHQDTEKGYKMWEQEQAARRERELATA